MILQQNEFMRGEIIKCSLRFSLELEAPSRFIGKDVAK